jgi:hypothetical protein
MSAYLMHLLSTFPHYPYTSLVRVETERETEEGVPRNERAGPAPTTVL